MSDSLLQAAINVRAKAYAPYSNFQVGAAVESRSGEHFTGVNVENASYGLTVCAERNAIAAAVKGGAQPGDIVRVTIVADAPRLASPCGACRQVLAEFGAANCEVRLYNLRDSSTQTMQLSQLLPHAFDRTSLEST